MIILFVIIGIIWYVKKCSTYEHLSEDSNTEIVIPDKCDNGYDPIKNPNPLCGSVFQNPTLMHEREGCGGVTRAPVVVVDDTLNFNDYSPTMATVPTSCDGKIHAPALVLGTSIGGKLKKNFLN